MKNYSWVAYHKVFRTEFNGVSCVYLIVYNLSKVE